MAAAPSEPVGVLQREGDRDPHPAALAYGNRISRPPAGLLQAERIERLHRLVEDREGRPGDRLAAVDPQADAPPAEAELLADGVDHAVVERPGLIGPLRAGGGDIGRAEPVSDGGRLLQDPLAAERRQRVDQRSEVLGTVELDIQAQDRLGFAHEPHAGLGDDAEVRLDEQLIPGRAVAIAVELPGRRACRRPHPGAHQVAVGQHHFEAAELLGVLAVGRVADAAIQGVADHRAPAVAGGGEPQRDLVALQVVIEVEEADARLQQDGAVLDVDFDLLHPGEVDDHRAGYPRRGAAVAEVLAPADRPERDALLRRDPDDRPHLLGGDRRHGRNRDVGAGVDGEPVGIGGPVLVGDKHVVGPDHRRERLQGSVDARRADAWGKSSVHAGAVSFS